MKAKLPKIAIGYIRGNEVSGAFMESLLAAILYDQSTWNLIGGRIIPHVCSHYLNTGRNTLIALFCANHAADAEVLVVLDTDQTFGPLQIPELVSLCTPETPIVSGLYWACDNDGSQVRPLMFRRKADETLVTDWVYPKNAMVERDAIGMGFCAIRTETLLKMRELNGDRWFDFDETVAGKFMPEDDAFCYRAQKFLGAKIHVHTGIQIGHVKPVVLQARDQKRKSK